VAALIVLHEGAEGERVRSWFEDAGFRVGPLVGISFSIEAARRRMGEVFPDFAAAEGRDRELSLDVLPAEIRSAVRAAATEAPPDFGPGNP
jgi:hypothetical protein